MAGAASPLQYLHGEVTCAICFNYYKNPVTVDCGHSFCSSCIVSRQVEDCKFPCPQCGRTSHVPVFNISTQLAKVTEIAKQMQLQTNKIPLCDLHGQHLMLFCKEDQTIMCVICKEAKGHTAHTVIPADQAAQECKAELQEVEYLLKKDMENILQWEYNHNYRFDKWQERVKETQQLIDHCFKKVQQLLHEEKKLLLRRLEHENEVMFIVLKENVNNVSRQKFSVQKLISDIEAKTKEPAYDILRDANGLFTRRNVLGIQEPACVPFAFRLNICLPGILELLQKYAAHVTLDPETSNFNLIISEDGKSVKYEGFNEELGQQSRNPKRFSTESNLAVLGNERFTSGRHYWEIEFDVTCDWEVGVCLDSVSREDFLSTFLDRGFWTVCTGIVFFPVKSPPRSRIGIFLDYEAGELMFYSITKNTAIKTFSETFTGTLRPFFEAHEGNHGGELTLCPVPQQCEDPAVSYILG